MRRRSIFLDLISFFVAILQLFLLIYLAKVGFLAWLAFYLGMGSLIAYMSYTIYPSLFDAEEHEIPDEANERIRTYSSLFFGSIWPIYPVLCILHLLGLVKLPERNESK